MNTAASKIIENRQFAGVSRNRKSPSGNFPEHFSCNREKIRASIRADNDVSVKNALHAHQMGRKMVRSPATVGIELVEAYEQADIQTVVSMMSFPFAIYLGSELLVLNSLKDAANLSAVYKQLVFRGKVRKLHASLMCLGTTRRDETTVDLRFRHEVAGDAPGHAAIGRFYFRDFDGVLKSEMLEIIEFDPAGPFALAFAMLKSSPPKAAELAI